MNDLGLALVLPRQDHGARQSHSRHPALHRVVQALAGATVDWDFEGVDRKIGFLNPDLGLINLDDDIPLWVSLLVQRPSNSLQAGAGWLNFGATGAEASLDEMKTAWIAAGNDAESPIPTSFLGAVLAGDQRDEEKLMAEAGPLTAVMFHNLAEVGAMGGRNLPEGPLSNVASQYFATHDHEPKDALSHQPSGPPDVCSS